MYIFFLLLVLVLKWVVMPNVHVYKQQIEAHLSAHIGQPVSIGAMEAGVVGIRPQFRFSSVRMGQPQEGRAPFEAVQVRADLAWSSLWRGGVYFHDIELIRPRIALEKTTDNWRIAGFDIQFDPEQTEPSGSLAWLLAQHRLIVRGGQFDLLASASQPVQRTGVLREVDIELKALFNQHWFKATVGTGVGLTHPARFTAQFTAPWGVGRANWRAWTGQLYAYGQVRQNDALVSLFKPNPRWRLKQWPVAQGVEAWVDFSQGVIDDGVAYAYVQNFSTEPLEALQSALQVERLASWVLISKLDPVKRTGSIRLKALNASVLDPDGLPIKLGPFDARASREYQANQVVLQGGVENVRADLALAMARRVATANWAKQQWAQHLSAYEASGLVQGFDVSVRHPKNTDFSIQGADLQTSLVFERLSISHTHPETGYQRGFRGLSGRINGAAEGGTWSISGPNSELLLDGFLEQKNVQLEVLSGAGRWSGNWATGEGLSIQAEELRLANQDFKGFVRGEYNADKQSPGLLAIQGVVERGDVQALKAYLPERLPDKVRQWLKVNLKSGTLENAVVSIQGEPSKLSFKDPLPNQRVVMAFPVTEGVLSFSPKWPLIEQIEGIAILDWPRLSVQASSARTGSLDLANVSGEINDLSRSGRVLQISGLGRGELADMVRYSNVSPVGTLIDGALSESEVQGNAQLDLNLNIPLSDVTQTELKADLKFDQNRIRLVPDMPWVEQVQGVAHFTETSLELDRVHGTAFGLPLNIRGGVKNGMLSVQAKGAMNDKGLAQYLNPLIEPYLTGQAAFDVNVTAENNQPVLSVSSNLKGIEILLPAPFAKPKQATLNFDLVRKSIDRDDFWEVSMQAPGLASAGVAAGLDENGQLAFLNIGLGHPPPVNSQGIAARLAVSRVDLDAWKRAFDDLLVRSPEAREVASGLISELTEESDLYSLPARVELSADRLDVVGKQFKSVSLIARQMEERWQFDVLSEGVKGYFSWAKTPQRPAGVVQGRFEKLTIPEELDSNLRDMVDEPIKSIPALDIQADHFVFGEMNLGRLKLVAENPTLPRVEPGRQGDRPNQWTLHELELSTPSSTLTATGTWTYDDALSKQLTEVSLSQTISDVGKTLERYGYKGVFQAGQATMVGDLAWQGAPTAMTLPTLMGSFTVESQKGQFLKADPGVAKLLGVLSLQGITRRLSLDFDDVFSKGFFYDELTASVTLDKGIATTPNFKMIGPSATVLMDGTLNLAKETQDLNVVVLPDLNPTGGSLVYSLLAANPAVGIASLLADVLLKTPISKLFALQYKVTGPWSEPTIEKIVARPDGEEVDVSP